MKKIGILFVSLVLFFTFFSCAYAQEHLVKSRRLTAPVTFNFEKSMLTITNNTSTPIQLSNAILQFYARNSIKQIIGLNGLKIRTKVVVNYFSDKPHNSGDLYQIALNEVNYPVLAPHESIQLQIGNQLNAPLHGAQLLVIERVPVPVKVTATNENWVTTLAVCNQSGKDVPLKDVEINFNYNTSMPTNIWGQPWLAWRLASQDGAKVVLLGGTEWVPPLPPDPNCTNPLTIRFNAAPETPLPTGPFVFKVAGGQPGGNGRMTVTMQKAPASGLPNPQVTVEGMQVTKQQIVPWGQQWKLTDLAPGPYTVNSTPVDNDNDYFQAARINVTVVDQQEASVTVKYQKVPSGKVTIKLAKPPQAQVPVKFSGQKYIVEKNVKHNAVVQLPADTYNVTSQIPGYDAIINPNPLIIPTHKSLSITYEPSNNVSGGYFVGYYQSWTPDSQTSDASKTNLANLPSYVNIVNLAFMKPAATYTKGSLNFSGTGLEFNYTGAVLKQAIAKLHEKNPATKVLVSVGGGSNTWESLNTKAIADFVADFGLDGVDIDFEPTTPGCTVGADNRIQCQIDKAFQGFVTELRKALPSPLWLTTTGFNVGAFGEDQWKNTPPKTKYTGMMLPFFRSPAVKNINLVNVMSYDGGTVYDPNEALNAYANYYNGPMNMGVKVPPEDSGDNVYTLCEVAKLTEASKAKADARNHLPGMMLWSLHKKPNGTPSHNNPSAQMMATTICIYLGLTNCNQAILINGFHEKARVDLKTICN